jgi:hypothetical protein
MESMAMMPRANGPELSRRARYGKLGWSKAFWKWTSKKMSTAVIA